MLWSLVVNAMMPDVVDAWSILVLRLVLTTQMLAMHKINVQSEKLRWPRFDRLARVVSCRAGKKEKSSGRD